MRHRGGLAHLGLIGAAGSYVLWFRGLARLGPAVVSMQGMMSPVTAVLLGWALLGQDLSPVQLVGAAIVLGSIWAGQRATAQERARRPVSTESAGPSSIKRTRAPHCRAAR